MSYIITKKGIKLDIKDINTLYPFLMLRNSNTETTLNVAHLLATEVYCLDKTSLQYRVLVNFLVQRSNKVKIISSIIELSKVGMIKEIDVPFFHPKLYNKLSENICITDCNKQKRYSYIDIKEIVSAYIKVGMNKLFLLFSYMVDKKKHQRESLVRAWVDVDERLHGEDIFRDSMVYLYPFGMNIARGINFIKYCFRKYDYVSLMGIPYSLKKLLKSTLQFLQGDDLGYVDFEIDGMVKHSRNLNKFKYIYTSDEYTPAVIALFENLPKNVRVVNDAHGIGFYNRFVSYSLFKVFNSEQASYYKLKNINLNIEIKNEDKSLNTIDFCNFELYKDIIIIDQGDLSKFGYMYESNLQQRLYHELNELVIQTKKNIKAKLHPNRSNGSKKMFAKRFANLEIINEIDTNNSLTTLFINLYSTAYFDFRQYGKVIFIKDNFFNPKLIFGENIICFTIEELVKNLKK